MIKIRNSFHNTVVRLSANVGDTLTQSQIRRARRELCGINGCACGGVIGERGEQNDGMFFIEKPDGSVEVDTE